MSLDLVTPPTGSVLTLDQAKSHLRVDTTDDDAYIGMLIDAAAQDAEQITGRALLPQVWQLTLDGFPNTVNSELWFDPCPYPVSSRVCIASIDLGGIVLQRPTVTAIASVQYVDYRTGALTTMDPSAYQLAAASDYTARLLPAYGTYWPNTRAQAEAVQIRFVCGYADAASVPAAIKSWMLLRIGALYENRSMWTDGRKPLNRNEFLDFMLDRYRAPSF